MLLELTMAMVATCMRAPAAAPRARGGPAYMLQPRAIAIDSDSDPEPAPGPGAPAGPSIEP